MKRGKILFTLAISVALILVLIFSAGCFPEGPVGATGPQGPVGAAGPQGAIGPEGARRTPR
ncbi:hypothetical protein ACFLUH_04120 [Chloroflexota bacterium]